MPRKHDVGKINLSVDDVLTFDDGFRIQWSSNIGFGEYDIYRRDGKWHGYSECMDNQDDKDFLRELLEVFVEQISIEG